MADRRTEIARKKAQIEQLRKERMQKEIAKKEGPSKTVSQTSSYSSTTDPDSVLREFGISISDAPPQQTTVKQSSSIATGSGEPQTTAVTQASPHRRNIQLSVVKVNEINIPPRENVAYSKETQTINPEPLDKD
ncbi:unnamed protein product, partial [Candidula unifasciata]